MTFEAFRAFSASNEWGLLWPEISMALLAFVILGLDIFVAPLRRSVIPALVFAGQSALLVIHLLSMGCVATDSMFFSGMIELTTLGETMRAFFMLSSLLVCYLGWIYFQKQNLPRSEFFAIVILVSSAMMLLAQSSNFVMLFVALETVTIGFYILVAYCRYSSFSLEGGLKYLILGALSSAILLFGIVLLYGVSGDSMLTASTGDGMNFAALGEFIAANKYNPIVLVGTILVICGIAFKIGAVPFQIWIPDVYQGAPTPVTAFLAVSSKAAGFVVLINLLRVPFASLTELTYPLLSAICAVTILFGNVTAIGQRNVKRVIGLSGIAHAGYLLLGVIAFLQGIEWAIWAIVFYLFTYLFASFTVFGVMAHIAGQEDENQELDHYQELSKKQPFLAGVLAIGLGSLAGIPPLGGFIGKLLIFITAFQAQLYTLLGVAIIGVVISIYYYFGWIREAFFKVLHVSREDGVAQTAPSRSLSSLRLSVVHRFMLGLLAAITVLLGVYQGAFGSSPF
ncbi:NADH-quinone oxidoreductase subunit N [Rubellicoccus peritrichatus]|uniref:NADH-quinone oxidoreductase subunit N n=1 Tax=Rubellicoccus peritrichatus TaxID=3080537 RepID=A0AAQ3QPU7_9BACT|nr:NADH-quinone oxidoreductase subunit N [Puniceicoccus sp. CR14]WOO39488.1 NADH-quinone oxidoreductase subunit N [Puniceicoccus sp. CR14]